MSVISRVDGTHAAVGGCLRMRILATLGGLRDSKTGPNEIRREL